ncbi:hypothetical protein D9M68_100250 [compost metagenome]
MARPIGSMSAPPNVMASGVMIGCQARPARARYRETWLLWHVAQRLAVQARSLGGVLGPVEEGAIVRCARSARTKL